MAPTLSSRGFLCQQLQVSLTTIDRAIRVMGLEPAAVVNGVEHYDAPAVAALTEWIRLQAKPSTLPHFSPAMRGVVKALQSSNQEKTQ